jgi:hypothetical protein
MFTHPFEVPIERGAEADIWTKRGEVTKEWRKLHNKEPK